MPTFEDPRQDADELGEVARGLAYATRMIERPADTYQVLGSLHYGLTSVQQSLNQLARWHDQHRDYAATDDGNREAGREYADKAGGWLLIAAASLDHVVELVMRAQGENGHIAWQKAPAVALEGEAATLAEALRDRETQLDPEPLSTTDERDSGRGLNR